MPTKENLATSNNVHSNTLGGTVATIILHNADVAGQAGGIASVNDTTSSDLVSAAALNKGSQSKSVQVTVAGNVRVSNPA